MNKTIKVMALCFATSLAGQALAGCGSTSGDSSAGTSVSASPSASSSAPARKGEAVTLRMTPTIRSSLADAYLMKMMAQYPRESTDNVNGPNNAHVGKTKGKYYAVADISLTDHPMTTQDGPHVWDSPNGTDWEYVGDTGGDVCGMVPRALVKAWGMPCT